MCTNFRNLIRLWYFHILYFKGLIMIVNARKSILHPKNTHGDLIFVIFPSSNRIQVDVDKLSISNQTKKHQDDKMKTDFHSSQSYFDCSFMNNIHLKLINKVAKINDRYSNIDMCFWIQLYVHHIISHTSVTTLVFSLCVMIKCN